MMKMSCIIELLQHESNLKATIDLWTYVKWATARVVGNSWCSPTEETVKTPTSNEPTHICDNENAEAK